MYSICFFDVNVDLIMFDVGLGVEPVDVDGTVPDDEKDTVLDDSYAL